MQTISLEVPEEILLNLHENKVGFADYIRKTIALDLYAEKHISLGYCADFCGMAKEDFIQFLGKNEISVFDFDSET